MAFSVKMIALKFVIGAVLSCLLTAMVAAQSSMTEPPISIPKECIFSQPAKVIKSLKDAPEIGAVFQRLGLAVADVGESYRPFDVIDQTNKDLPSLQFVRAYQFEDRTIGWYVRGGFGTNWHVFEMRYQRDRADGPLLLGATSKALSGSPCNATQALLDGVASASGW